MAEVVVVRPPVRLPTRVEVVDKLERLQDAVGDLNTRLIDVEHFLARLALPTLPEVPTLPEYFPKSSRWVLEVFPDEIAQWREAIRSIPTETLSERERTFLRNMDYYIVSERKVTIPQMAWLGAIIRRVGDHLPEVPLLATAVTGGSSNPEEVEKEVAKVLRAIPPEWRIERVRRVGIIRPRLLVTVSRRVRSSSHTHTSSVKCPFCGGEIPKGWDFCPKCRVPIVKR